MGAKLCGHSRMRKDIEQLRGTFNSSAGWYDLIRPGYPEELVDDVIRISAISPQGEILEIGSGTGKATQMFASRGFSMLCLEIGKDMAAVATQKLRQFGNVSIVLTSFEEWEPGSRLFDLVIAATSFHWVDPAIAYSKSAAVLKPGGTLAVFLNRHIRRDEGFFVRVQDVYRAAAPLLARAGTHSNLDCEEPPNISLFDDPVVRSYQWAAEYTAKEYVDLLGTYSDHISLPEIERGNLFSGIAELIDREYGGRVLKHYETVLTLRRKKKI